MAEVEIKRSPDGYCEITLDGAEKLRIKFNPGEIDEVERNGETVVMINIDGLSRMLVEGSVNNKNLRWERFIEVTENSVERRRERFTLEQWMRFKEAVAVARADLP